jgi:hypothetical protein
MLVSQKHKQNKDREKERKERIERKKEIVR